MKRAANQKPGPGLRRDDSDMRLSRRMPGLALLAAPLLAAPAMAAEPLPRFLDCPITIHAGWTAEDIRIVPPPDERHATTTIHLDTRSGQWMLSNAMSAALTIGGGTFDILHDGTGYRTHWIGSDREGREHLRIAAERGRYPFVFLDRDGSLQMGTCEVPAEVFLLLR